MVLNDHCVRLPCVRQDGVDYWMDDVFMHRFTTDQMVMYLSGQLRPILIPEMPMFLTYTLTSERAHTYTHTQSAISHTFECLHSTALNHDHCATTVYVLLLSAGITLH